MESEDADRHFIDLGIQYYTAARCGVLAGLSPVCGTLYHHALEMLIKARLCQTKTLLQLSKPPFSHDLALLWDAFKKEFPDKDLTEFDDTIRTISRFERIRYPDETLKRGAEIVIQWSGTPGLATYGPGIKPSPRYQIVVDDIDRLVARILKVSSRNPKFFTAGMKKYARDAIMMNNSACTDWFD